MKPHLVLALTLAAGLVSGAAAAQMPSAPPPTLPTPRWESDVYRAFLRGNHRQALVLAVRDATWWPDDPWSRYEYAVALGLRGRPDEAALRFAEAETLFSPAETYGRSVAMYGRARALYAGGRCNEAAVVYTEYAELVGSTDPLRAASALSQAVCTAPAESDPDVSDATTANIQGDHAKALEALAASHSKSPWAAYNRGTALTGLGKTDEAIAAFDTARARFGGNVTGVSISLWGRARALDRAGRCEEAKAAYDAYAVLVRDTDADGAKQAAARAAACPVTVKSPQPIGKQ